MNNKWTQFLFNSAMLALGISLSANAANNDEWWEYSTEMEGMGGISMPAQKDCYRKNNIVPSGGGEDDCSQSNVKQRGNKFSADFACKDGTKGHMEGSQTGDTSSFKVDMKDKTGQSMTMTQKGKKLGSCNWETDSNEAKFCASLNKTVASSNADNKKSCEEALKKDDFYAFLMEGSTGDASANLAGKKCGGNVTGGCKEQRPKMCSKISGYLKDTSGEAKDYKKVARDKSGATLAKECNSSEFAAATKRYCSDNALKAPIKSGGDAYEFCNEEATALAAKHCPGRDYTVESSGPYGQLCRRPGSTGSDTSSDGSSNSTSGSADKTKGTNPIDGAVKGVKKLKDVFGF